MTLLYQAIFAAFRKAREAGRRALFLPLLMGGLGLPVAHAQVQVAARAQPLAGTTLLQALPDRPALSQAQPVLRRELALTTADDLRLLRTETDAEGGVHERFQQYYQGVKVEHGVVSLHARAGRIEVLSGELERAAAMPPVQPALTEAAALQHALQAVGARVYQWQLPAEERALKALTANPLATYQPKGELVVVGDFRQPEVARPLVLAWKFNIYAHAPLSRELVYVDARSGQVVLRDAVIKHLNVTGTGTTRYLGQRPIFADQTGSGFRLRESVHGKGVVTLNALKSDNYGAAVDFVDNDNNWTAAEYNNANFDNAALDAHIGAQATQDYWTTVHGRDSFDDKGTILTSYVHFDDTPGDGVGLENAFWNGAVMSYGDGASHFRPLTAVDVCGHEIGHAVCSSTANLLYNSESGALNEGLSDIWGACVENHLDPTKQIWLIGEDIDKLHAALRSMSNPNAFGQPDTYKGTSWYNGTADNGGVHTNSGVLNYWFYLLSVGGSGTNDNNKAYNVTGITIGSAARIVYRAERFYLTANSNYSAARQATLQAAVDLFGLGSTQVEAVAKAWRAVGVEQTENAPTISNFSPANGLVGANVVITGTNLGSTYRVQFNGTDAVAATYTSLTSVTVKVPAGATTGTITLTTATGSVTTAGNFTVLTPGPAPTITSFAPAGGAVQGGAVTLTGTNFTGATALSFNGAAAVFTVLNATTITTFVPVGAGSGALTVTTPNGSASITFTVLPAITSFTPLNGPGGTTVTITGTTLGAALNVKFNGLYATSYTVLNATTVTAQVPLGATTGPLTVRTPDGTATGPVDFTVTAALAFNSFTPTQGPIGTVVTIYGQGFTGTTGVAFNGTAASFTVASSTEIWATVPAGAGSGFITLTTPLGPATSPRMFGVTGIPGGPSITSFTPANGPVGASITITGTNFSGATGVGFNGTPATTFNVVSATSITATVPAGATSGPITVTTPVTTCLSLTDFFVSPPNDFCANAITVTCGSSVTGSTLGATNTGDPSATCGGAPFTSSTVGVFYRFVGVGGNVTVNTCTNASYDGLMAVYTGTCGAYTCVSGNDDGCGPGSASIVTFPSVLGTVYYIYVSGYLAADVGNFTLSVSCANGPAITSFTPGSGPVGTAVSLVGTNFTGATAVKFNGTAAAFTLNSATSISTTVPVGASTGYITVATPVGTGTSPTAFSVLPSLPTIVAFTPGIGLAGTAVVLTGTGFTGATAVRFNGTTAASFTVNSATSITATVPGTATTGFIAVDTPSGTGTSATAFDVLSVFTGTANQCLSTTPISSTGAGTWQWLRAANGQVVAAINDQGFALGQVTAEFTLNQGPVRVDARGREYLDRNWHLLAQNAFVGRTVLVRFYGTNSEFATFVAANDGDVNDVTALTQLRLTQYSGTNEDCQLANNSGTSRLLTPAAPITLTGAPWFGLEASVPDHFSEFYLGGGAASLPVELAAFTAQRQGQSVLAQWNTAQEVNNKGFVVERSANGQQFTAVSGLLPGTGSTTTPQAYAFTDAQAPLERTYYRLRQVDASGVGMYSPVVSVAAAIPAPKLSCYPQPAHSGAFVTGATPDAAVTLFDALGRTVATAQAGATGQAELHLPVGLAAGVYVVRSGAQATRLTVE
ncbi:M4 family metallopeptidase [Hymenobacter negativus]|uniref:M4 family metallopeptidase n=1 Tax=Hymenobacter negativus TaxID=2795026 RepID=A0ABS3QNB6_9BACT|nr:M4 family metallopeptidase [Hymenobacter negativus]MBO2012781.1 M4 family metallopeptidase [Hymenobacter negativus]